MYGCGMMRFVAFAVVLVPGLAVAQGGNPSFNLVNRAPQAINEVYATPAGVDRWGRDRLARSFLAPGQMFPVQLPADGNCVYDLRIVYADGRPEERRRLDTCEIETVTFPGGRPGGRPGGAVQGQGPVPDPAAADDPSFRLVNRGRSEATELYASPSGDENWGQDRLGSEIVAAGGSRVVRLPRGECRYDVRIVFGNGQSTEKRKVNLCTLTDLRVP